VINFINDLLSLFLPVCLSAYALCMSVFGHSSFFLSYTYSVSLSAFCLYSVFLPSWLCCFSFCLFVFVSHCLSSLILLSNFYIIFIFLYFFGIRNISFLFSGKQALNPEHEAVGAMTAAYQFSSLSKLQVIGELTHINYVIDCYMLYVTWKIWVDFIILVK
jgi:hypothetical protein